MNLIEKVKLTIKKHKMLDIGDIVIIGLSGGPDSVALLLILNEISKDFDIKLIGSHLNYKLRGDESDRDEEFVELLCNRLEIPINKKICRLNTENAQLSVQECARIERYKYYDELLQSHSANKIATGHNQDDSVETIFFNLLRGCGLSGLSGIPPKRDKIIRPLIECSREEIIVYLEEINQEYRIDSSNLKNKYSRNKIRNILLPKIRDSFNSFSNHNICQMAEIIRDENNFLEGINNKIFKELCDVKLKDEGTSVHFYIDKLHEQHIALQRRIIRSGIKKTSGDLMQFEKKHIDYILDLLKTEGKERRIDLPRDLEVIKSYNKLIIRKKIKPVNSFHFKDELTIPGKIIFGKDGCSIKTEIIRKKDIINLNTQSSEVLIDYSKCGTLYVRYRFERDTFIPFGMKGTKKLMDYFIDMKVPRYKRNNIPIIISNEDIVWIAGYTIDDRYKVTDMTEEVLHIVYIQGDMH